MSKLARFALRPAAFRSPWVPTNALGRQKFGNYALNSLGGKMQINPYIEDGIERLRTNWPQAHLERNKYGYHLIVVPGILLPKGWDSTICTVLFISPPGYPAACPDHFFTDIDIRVAKNKAIPHNVNISNGAQLEQLGWPQWKECVWWSWHLQMWNPNQSSLFTYMKVIQQRFNYVK